MSSDEPPSILLKWCKDRSGIRLKPEFLKDWYQSRTTPIINNEMAYKELVSYFLAKDISISSESVIQENFGKLPIDTFPLGHLRHGGGVVLQIQDTIDISNSTFSLLNTLNNLTPIRHTYVERGEQEEVKFPRGTLRWTLTDGFKQIQAMELEAIPELNLKTSFGCKILIDNCQVRRGMLLLSKSNVKVLGGNVPELYGGNMIAELEKRFKMKLGIIEEPVANNNSNASEAVTGVAVTGASAVNEFEDFDDDDMDYNDIDAFNTMEVDHFSINNNMPPQEEIDDIFRDDGDDDFMDPPVSFKSASPLRPNKSRVNSTQQQSLVSHQNSNKRTREDYDVSEVENTTPNKRQDSVNNSDDNGDLSWIDSSVWDNLDENEAIDMKVDQDGNAKCTFEILKKALKAMEKGNYAGNIADTVTVKVKCLKLAKLRMSSISGFYLEVEIGDPVNESLGTIKAVFNNEILVKLLGVEQKDVIQLNKTSGKKAVAKQIFKPFETKITSTLAYLDFDLTVLESEASNGVDSKALMPLVTSYQECP